MSFKYDENLEYFNIYIHLYDENGDLTESCGDRQNKQPISSVELQQFVNKLIKDFNDERLLFSRYHDSQTESMKIVCSPCYGTEDVAVCRTCDWVDKFGSKRQANKLYWY